LLSQARLSALTIHSSTTFVTRSRRSQPSHMSDSKQKQALHYPYGPPLISGQIKQQAEDFRVDEQMGFSPSGAGEHLWLKVEKNNLTSAQLIEKIAAQCGVSAKQVGYSGLKDKQAVTRQWLSVQMPGCKQIPELLPTDEYRILQAEWHDKKLRVGSHRYNDFNITIRQVSGNMKAIATRIDQVNEQGFANYFGEQRFGVQQDNVSRALQVLGNRHKSKRLSRHKRSLYLSALRSELFNRILDHRIACSIWQLPVDGDLFMLDGSQSIFSEELDDQIISRYQSMDIHCAISLAGQGESRLSGQAKTLEEEVIQSAAAIHNVLLNQDVKRAYRANRAQAHQLQIETLDETTIRLRVRLEKGVFLTSLLSHFVAF